MKRTIIAVVVGLAAAIVTFLLAETFNAYVHPTPTSFDFNDSIAVQAFYDDQPLRFWLIVLLGWVVGSFLCGLLIKWISRSEFKKLPIIAGVILTLSSLANFFVLPHPTWFMIVSIFCFIPATLAGHRLLKLT